MKAVLANHNQAPRKVRLVTDLVKGKTVEEALTASSPEISGIVEEHFPMAGMTDSHAFYGSGGDDAELNRRITELMTSVARFGADQGLDLVPTSRYFWHL